MQVVPVTAGTGAAHAAYGGSVAGGGSGTARMACVWGFVVGNPRRGWGWPGEDGDGGGSRAWGIRVGGRVGRGEDGTVMATLAARAARGGSAAGGCGDGGRGAAEPSRDERMGRGCGVRIGTWGAAAVGAWETRKGEGDIKSAVVESVKTNKKILV